MKKVTDDMRLIIKVSDMYYNQNLGQNQIAKELGLSRPTIAKLLESGMTRGLVRIEIDHLDMIEHWDLEHELKEAFGLKEVVITDAPDAEHSLIDRLGQAGAIYLRSILQDDDTVGFSMGTTLHALIAHMDRPEAENLTFVPLIGGSGSMRMELHSNSLAEAIARKCDARFLPLVAPARVSDTSTQKRLMKEEVYREPLQAMKHLDLAMVGIGYPNEDSAIAATAYYRENEVDYLRGKGVVGDICMQFYDENGSTEAFKSDNHVVGIDINRLKRVPLCMGIAGGAEKRDAILGAIRGGFINGLITDEDCARALLREQRGEKDELDR